MKRVVGDESTPDQRPKGVEAFAGITSADRFVERSEEGRAAAGKLLKKRLFALAERVLGGSRGRLRRQQCY